MQQVDSIQLVPKFASIINWVVHSFASPRISTPQPDQDISIIDWPDSDPDFDPRKHYHGPHEQPISGGYNEAFIVQYWTSYHLR
jgi:hypothetical protein